MNKRIEKKLKKQAELAHADELRGSAWGRIKLSYERLEAAFIEFLQTLSTELKEAPQLARELAREELKSRAKSLGKQLSPQVAKVPVVGARVARGIHDLASAAN